MIVHFKSGKSARVKYTVEVTRITCRATRPPRMRGSRCFGDESHETVRVSIVDGHDDVGGRTQGDR